MGLLPEHICGHDIDEVFAYPTTQFARIRDARLGLFKYILTFGIILYVGIYQLWMNGGYLAESTVTGTTRFTLQQPTKNACSPDDVGCTFAARRFRRRVAAAPRVRRGYSVERVAAAPRTRRGYSAETSRGAAADAT